MVSEEAKYLSQILIHESFSTRWALNEPEIRTNTTAAAAAVTEDRLSRIWLRALNKPESDNKLSKLHCGMFVEYWIYLFAYLSHHHFYNLKSDS